MITLPVVGRPSAIRRFVVELETRSQELLLEVLADGRYRVRIGGADGRVRVLDARRVAGGGKGGSWSLVPEGGGRVALVDVEGEAPAFTVSVDGVSLPLKVLDERRHGGGVPSPSAKGGPQSILSPMPGKVVRVLARPGEEVQAGQAVVVVEAMKMENELRASRAGRVKEVRVREGAAVESGQILAILE